MTETDVEVDTVGLLALIPSLTPAQRNNWQMLGHLPSRRNQGRGRAGGNIYGADDVAQIRRIVELVADGWAVGIASRMAREGWTKKDVVQPLTMNPKHAQMLEIRAFIRDEVLRRRGPPRPLPHRLVMTA